MMQPAATPHATPMIELAIDAQRRVATATLARPPVNGMNAEWQACFAGVLDRVEATPGLAVLRVRSACQVFSAGGDLAFMQQHFGSPSGRAVLVEHVAHCQRQFARLAALPLVTVAQLNGHALGGGFELALACDFRLLAEDALVGLPEVSVGLIPGGGGTQRAVEVAGRAVARRLILTAKPVGAPTALAWHLCDAVHPAAALDAETLDFCNRIARLPASALASAKRCIAAAGDATLDGYGVELEAIASQFADAEARERIAAFFARKATSA